MIRLTWRLQRAFETHTLNLGVFVAILLASIAAGLMGGIIVWALWRFDVLQLGDRRRDP